MLALNSPIQTGNRLIKPAMPEHHLTNSEQQPQQQPRRFTRSAAEREKARHICSILSTIRRPASPEEFASRCRSFDATADIVPRLCSIPNSPIYLADKGLATVSAAAVSASGEFVPDTMRNGTMKTYSRKRKREVSDNAGVPTAKRKLLLPTENGEADGKLGCLRNASNRDFLEGNSNNERALVPLRLDSNPPESSSFCMTHLEHGESNAGVQSSTLMHEESQPDVHHSLHTVRTSSCSLKPVEVDRGTACFLDVKLPPQSSSYDREPCQEAVAGKRRLENETDSTPTFFLEEDKQSNMDAGICDTHLCKASTDQLKEDAQTPVENNVEEGFPEFGAEAEAENFVLSVKLGGALASCLDSRNAVNITLDKDQSMKKAESTPDPILAECPSPHKQFEKSLGKFEGLCKNLPCQERVLMESLEYNELVNIPKQENQCKTYQKSPSVEPNLKSSKKKNIQAKENMVDTTSISPQLERILPQLDNFIIEQEEGSGGYGTVYRAKRKNDGKRFAIKYPHVKAHKHHVDTERKMLEHFGGRNFIIKCEGSLRSGDSECFILEHVEHDRPEVLKKEIDLYQLQWYGYCMFRALDCLHKQDVVHRDVKPGNFLFSRRLNKGYLIDFNLAKHLPQNYTIGSKSKSSPRVSFSHVPLPQSKSALLNREKKFVRRDLTDTKLGPTTDSKRTHDPRKDVRKWDNDGPLKNYPDMGGGNRYKSQGAEGSGITSAKDVISTRTPCIERAREPLPCLGRKELISLVQDVVLGPNHDAKNTPASQRKRIAATSGKIDNKIIYTSPMSLHFKGGAVSAAKLLKSIGDGRQKKEGSSVGTKGFRAPEVLLRSLHQGPKVDVWSAGVTLLYLVMGRTPFTGEPEQSLKDIATLRGSEDLWEVAKLHNRESSFPVELLDIKSLPSMKLQSWCKARTKRGQFFRQIPRSLFDLVDKCLTVNPRLRITTGEALQHDFFAPCHESLTKQRMFRCEVMSTQNE